jgi:hypothetical protein
VSVGIHTMDAAAYHDDPCERPSLSASLCKILISQSPAHAKAAHPRLNPDYKRTDDDKFSVGTCAHSLLLEGEAGVAVVPYDDWRTNAAKELRDEARQYGRVPLLARDWDQVQAMCAATRVSLSFTHRPAKRERTPLVVGLVAGAHEVRQDVQRAPAREGARERRRGRDAERGGREGPPVRGRVRLPRDATSTRRSARAVHAGAEGYALAIDPAVVIVDSVSHMHNGPGGMLEYHEARSSGWAAPTRP